MEITGTKPGDCPQAGFGIPLNAYHQVLIILLTPNNQDFSSIQVQLSFSEPSIIKEIVKSSLSLDFEIISQNMVLVTVPSPLAFFS